jgi:hypothetical protein
MNSYWRYEQVSGGVIVECESLTLSRAVPFLLEPLIHSLVESTARESLERTLASMRSHHQTLSPPSRAADELDARIIYSSNSGLMRSP